MTNELNRVHQAEAGDSDGEMRNTLGWNERCQESGVEWIYAGSFSKASIWRENGRVWEIAFEFEKKRAN